MLLQTALGNDPIFAYIHDGISSEGIDPKKKLPTEREFAELFGMSRGSVRKTLLLLEAEGMIVRHVGRGTFVSPKAYSAGKPLFDMDPDTSPAEFIEARLVFEPNLAELVVANATSADFRKMSEYQDAMTKSTDLKSYEHNDDMFHLAIAEATHNGLLIGTAGTLSAAGRNATWGQLKERQGTLKAARRKELRTEHKAILAALKERDVELATRCLTDHLVGIRCHLLGR